MREKLRPLLSHLASFVAPGLVLLLLAIQVRFGLRGFDQPHESLLYVLQVPGVLLGWGGVALLLPLLVWMVLDWWGYDLGGFALKGLGSAVLGIATGAICGLVGFVAAGGIVGGGLADVLRQSVGVDIAFGVLGLMVIPAAILAFSMQKRAERPARKVQRTDTVREDGEPQRPQPRYGFLAHLSAKLRLKRIERDPARDAWYPEPRYDAHGNEIPMEFARHRDIGGIRFVDEDEPEADEAEPSVAAADEPAAQAPPEPQAEPLAEAEAAPVGDVLAGEERLPTIPELLAGNYAGRSALDDVSGGPRETGSEQPDDGPVHVDSEGRPNAESARPLWVPNDELAPSADAPIDAPPIARREEPTQQKLSFVPARDPEPVGEPALPPGVRYADDPAPPPVEDDQDLEPVEDDADIPADLPALSAALEHAVRGPAADPDDTAHTARSVRETLRQRVEAIRSDGASSRYMAKLEAIGLFDPAEPGRTEDAQSAKAAKKKTARKKAAKKKAARKKVARKKAAKKVAKRSAVRRPKKKAAARRKPAAKRPTAVERAAAAEARRKTALIEALRIERLDPLFARAVAVSLERGASSPVLLTRRLGLPFARAREIVDRMIATGVLEEASPSGSHALLISAQEWEQARGS